MNEESGGMEQALLSAMDWGGCWTDSIGVEGSNSVTQQNIQSRHMNP
jgi:hypothetical protein